MFKANNIPKQNTVHFSHPSPDPPEKRLALVNLMKNFESTFNLGFHTRGWVRSGDRDVLNVTVFSGTKK